MSPQTTFVNGFIRFPFFSLLVLVGFRTFVRFGEVVRALASGNASGTLDGHSMKRYYGAKQEVAYTNGRISHDLFYETYCLQIIMLRATFENARTADSAQLMRLAEECSTSGLAKCIGLGHLRSP